MQKLILDTVHPMQLMTSGPAALATRKKASTLGASPAANRRSTPSSGMDRTSRRLEEELRQFTSTQNYFKHFPRLLYTDGIQHLAERAGCYWLIDLVGSYQPRLLDTPVQIWEVAVNKDKSALVTIVEEEDGEPVKVSQTIPLTDFPLQNFSFYTIDGVMLLRSEY